MTRKLNHYLEFLMNMVNASEDEYSMLFEKMLHTPFIYFIGNDDNRAEDGLDLRFEYEEEYGRLYDLNENECSLLEMLIALARRCDVDMMYDEDRGDRIAKWFWTMMDNIGLSKFTNSCYSDVSVERICDIFINRKYKSDGTCGGAWPSKCRREDLRLVELWYQMSWYMLENEEI